MRTEQLVLKKELSLRGDFETAFNQFRREGKIEMECDTVQNENRKLLGGEIVHLVKNFRAKWRISSYECPQGVEIDGFFFCWLQGLPEDWKDQEFEDTDQAVEFVQQQIQSGWVPANRQSN